jgi:hypothetical protein
MIGMPRRDLSLDTLLDLHGRMLVIDKAGYRVKFVVKKPRALVGAFWKEVESVMREKGVWS